MFEPSSSIGVICSPVRTDVSSDPCGCCAYLEVWGPGPTRGASAPLNGGAPAQAQCTSGSDCAQRSRLQWKGPRRDDGCAGD